MGRNTGLRTGIVYGTAGLLLAGATALGYRSYRRDLARASERLAAYDSEVVSTSLGDVEYCVRGEGTPALVAHGICGGFDAALAAAAGILDDGYRVVGVSRFGYLGSDLPDDPTPARQADAYRELLDYLGIDEVVVLGVSAGGPVALQFAARYPDRTRALVLVGAAVPTDESPEGPTGPPAPLLRDLPFWVLVDVVPSLTLRLFGVDRRTYARLDPGERRGIDATLATLLPMGPRRAGAVVDARVTNPDVVENADGYDLESIAVPGVVVNAEDDPLADFDAARRAAARIPTAEFLGFEDGGHLVVGHRDEVRAAVESAVAGAGA